jgi:hydrogenase maturation protease
MSPPADRKVLVLALGNADRGDDGVGARVAAKLAGRLPADVRLKTRAGDMLSLLDDWAGFDAVVCVDAAAPLTAAGRIYRIDLATNELPSGLKTASSHAFGLAEAIRLARTLGCAPRDIIVYAIEGRGFDPGAPLTCDVAAAADDAAGRVIAEVERLRAPAQTTGC